MIPKIEEYMIFENNNGETGIILKSTNKYYSWWKCYKCGGGQVFNEDVNDSSYINIIKLFKCTYRGDEQYYSHKFMANKNFNDFECIYDRSKQEERKRVTIKRKCKSDPNIHFMLCEREIMRSLKECRICGETIEVVSENKWQESISDYVLYLKTHFHYKKHGIQYLKAKGIIKCSFKIVGVLLLYIILFPISLISYPFWWVYEKINY